MGAARDASGDLQAGIREHEVMQMPKLCGRQNEFSGWTLSRTSEVTLQLAWCSAGLIYCFFDVLIFAQRFRCAAAILALPAADMPSLLPRVTLPLLLSPANAFIAA